MKSPELPPTDTQAAEANRNCLYGLIKRGQDTPPADRSLEGSLNRHVLYEMSEQEIIHKCAQCPVISTAKLVGQKALISFRNNAECPVE